MTAMAASTVRAAALRSRCLSLAKTCSIGFRSGEYFGRKNSFAPADRMAEDEGGVRRHTLGGELVAFEEHHPLRAAVRVLEGSLLLIADAVCAAIDLVATHVAQAVTVTPPRSCAVVGTGVSDHS